jgi:phenylalanyl-tRNA synthetase beta chain
MGSGPSGVTKATTNILLESAIFKPQAVSASARKHGLVSEASMRFERSVDAAMVKVAMERASNLIVSIFGGKAGDITVCGDELVLLETRVVKLSEARMAARLGVDVPRECDATLARMGFGITRKDGNIHVVVPTQRNDVSIPEDVMEEYARVFGYEHVPATMPRRMMQSAAGKNRAPLAIAIEAGFQQVIGYAFISTAMQRQFAPESKDDVLLANPISQDMGVMRRSLWPGMFKIAAHNLARQQSRVAIVEQGLTYRRKADGIAERHVIAWLLAGDTCSDTWHGQARRANFFDLKGAMESWLAAQGLTARFIADDHCSGLQAGQSAKLLVGTREAGSIGRVDEAVASSFGVDAPVFVAEVMLDDLPVRKPARFASLPEYPSVTRDLVFLFGRRTEAESIMATAKIAAGSLLVDATIFDRYTGKGVPEDKVSLGLRFVLRADDRTLTQEEVDAVSQAIVAAMAKRFDAALRG